MSNKFTKIAEERKKRVEALYAIEEDYSAYTAVCPDHAGVRWAPISEAEKISNKIDLGQVAWRCPIDQKIYKANGSVADQTDGFAEHNNLHRNPESIVDEGFEAVKKLSKAMGYNTTGTTDIEAD